MPEIIDVLFAPDSHEGMNVTLTPVHRWTEWTIPGHGTVSILDARDAGDSAQTQIQDELRREPADVVFFLTTANRTMKPSSPAGWDENHWSFAGICEPSNRIGTGASMRDECPRW